MKSLSEQGIFRRQRQQELCISVVPSTARGSTVETASPWAWSDGTLDNSPMLTCFARILLPDDEGHVTTPFKTNEPFCGVIDMVRRKLAPKRWFRDGISAYTFFTFDVDGTCTELTPETIMVRSIRLVSMIASVKFRSKVCMHATHVGKMVAVLAYAPLCCMFGWR